MEFDVAFLDIGHGDCTVITFTELDETASDGERRRCIVVDGGEEGTTGISNLQPDAPSAAWRLAEYLKTRNIHTIDLLIATHMDSDHIGGLLAFLRDHTAKEDGLGSRYWNNRVTCIGQYWGPMRDRYWGLIDKEQGKGEGKRYLDLIQLLIKFKVKKKQSSQDREEIERLEREIGDLRESLDELVASHNTRGFIAQSVRQNCDLGDMVRHHVADPAQDIMAPDLLHPPPSPFESVRVDLLWPDVQLPDSMITTSLFRPVNAMAPPARSWGRPREERLPSCRMDLAGLLEWVLDNQEQLACMEDRKANNRSIVVSVRPMEWNGPDESWPVVLLTGDAESESWERMVPRYGGSELSAHILKVPNHGSGKHGVTAEALRVIHPRFAIISVGQIHHLPAAKTLDLLRQSSEAPLDIFCTERNHNPNKHGACLPLPPGCVRHTFDDYRGVAFGFNTEQGSLSVVELRFVKKGDRYELEAHWVRDHESDPQRILWCRQEAWETTADRR